LVAIATSLNESEKLVWIDNFRTNTFHLVKKIVKIGPADPEIALLFKKKKETKGKIYSPVSNLAERAKTYLNVTLAQTLTLTLLYVTVVYSFDYREDFTF